MFDNRHLIPKEHLAEMQCHYAGFMVEAYRTDKARPAAKLVAAIDELRDYFLVNPQLKGATDKINEHLIAIRNYVQSHTEKFDGKVVDVYMIEFACHWYLQPLFNDECVKQYQQLEAMFNGDRVLAKFTTLMKAIADLTESVKEIAGEDVGLPGCFACKCVNKDDASNFLNFIKSFMVN